MSKQSGESKNSKSFISIGRITPKTTVEEKLKLENDYELSKQAGYECELIDEVEGYRKYSKDGQETHSKLYANLLRCAVFSNHAFDVWAKIDELLRYKEKPREICKPIRAAIDAGVIERPQYEDFISDFNHFDGKISDSRFDELLKPLTNPYDRDNVYNMYKSLFEKMKTD